MAKQKGIIKIEGTVGDITFYKTADGYIAKEYTAISADRIAKDPAFQRTRENGAEFARAGKAGKLVRNAFRTLLQNAKDSRVTSRLTAEMMKVIKADATSNRGMRNVIDGELELIRGFEFNNNAPLSTTVFAPFTAQIDRATGQLTVTIQSFVPLEHIVAPEGATHYNIVSMGAALNFTDETFNTDQQQSGLLPINNLPAAALNLQNALPAGTTDPLFLLLGIQFFQQVNGTSYPLKNDAFNSLKLVAVEGV